MKTTPLATRGILLASLAFASAGTAQEAEQTSKMTFKAFKKWSFVMPKEKWDEASSGLSIKHPNGSKFVAHRSGVKLMVDVNADGEVDKPVKGIKGFLVLRSKGENKSFRYAVRFKGGNGKYKFTTSGGMCGTVAGTKVTLIDGNNDGDYNDLGEDAMVVGKGKAASFLSSVVSLGGNLYNMEVNADGSEVKVTPFDGESGTLNLASGFKSSAQLVSAVVKSGDMSFNLAGLSKGLLVPAGSYTLEAGMVRKGKHTARIRKGNSASLDVNAGGTTKLRWGNKVIAEFDHSVAGDKVTVQPTALHYYGLAGEEYHGFVPDIKAPKIFVYSEKGKEIGKGQFGF